MSPRFCGSCGAALTPGGAYCGACGSVVVQPPAAAPSPPPAPPPPVAAAPSDQPPPPAPDQPPAPAPATPYGDGDWSSVELQPGETSLGTWLVALQSLGPDVTGALTITDRRLLFKPKVAGTSLFGMLLSQRKSFKDQHTIVLRRDEIVSAHTERHVLNLYIYVTTADGAVAGFNRGLMSPDPIMAILQPG